MTACLRRHIAYFFCFVSMIMLAVTVVPHHHHHSEQICLKNDLTENNCCRHASPAANEHCCCNTGCITTHFFPKQPSTPHSLQPHYAWASVLCDNAFLLKLLNLPATLPQRREYIYLESLHGTFIARAKGLRAPPSVLI